MSAFSFIDGEVNDLYIPSAIIWDPYLMYPSLFPPGSIKCSHCGELMFKGYWNDGSTVSKQPRIIHGIDSVVVLVSAEYVCENRHKIVAHDEAVLQMFPSQELIPFVLLHRTGFTRELVDMCTAFCRRGINFYNMESLIVERRWESYVRQKELHHLISLHPYTTNDFWSSLVSKSPSNNVLAKCFLAGFLQHEQKYLREMMSMPTGDTISFDHTFKVVSNIGYLREDSKWINEYDSLFIVLNDKGQVLTWQLTKQTSFGHVTPLLQDLFERSQSCIKTVYIDDCCKLRGKLATVLGPGVAVKLDLFHGVQRVTKTLSRKHTHKLTQRCMQDLRLVFRQDGDSSERRMCTTPTPQVMMTKMDSFITKWKDVANDKGVRLFSAQTDTALNNLKCHIQRGCLSAIPPGAGTNRNERLHQCINSFFHRSRIGILLAYALLTLIFHAHNSAERFAGKLVVRPIAASPLRGSSVAGSIPPIGIMPKHQLQHKQQLQMQEGGSDHWEIDVESTKLDVERILPIYQRSLQKLEIQRGLSKMKLCILTSMISQFQVFSQSSATNTERSHPAFERKLSDYVSLLPIQMATVFLKLLQ